MNDPVATLETALQDYTPLTIEATSRLRDLADALDARAVAAYETSETWSEDGHTCATNGLRYRCNQSTGTAWARLRLSRQLAELDQVRDAFEAGEIGLDAVHAIVRHDTDDLHDALVEDQKLLVEKAAEFEYPDLVAQLAQWARNRDPERVEHDAKQRHESRTASKSRFAGNCRVDATLPGLGGVEFAKEHDRIEEELFRADWAEARNRLGDQATQADLCRTREQRAADALVEMARRSAEYGRTMADEHGNVPLAPRARVVVNILTGHELFIAELAALLGNPIPYPQTRLCQFEDGTPLAPSEMLGHAIGGEVRRVVFGADGHILDYGKAKRLFTGPLAEAIRLRDPRCQHPGCEIPSSRCQIDHVIEHQHGGQTNEANGEPLCGTHNRWKTAHPERSHELRAEHRRKFRKRPPPLT